MNNSDLIYKIAIGQIPGIGSITAKKLIAYTGSIEGVFKQKTSSLLKIPGIGTYLANQITSQQVLKKAEDELAFIQKHNIKPLFYLDKEYPYRLKQCPDAPIVIFVKGEVNLNHSKIISIVGTRSATTQGYTNCYTLVANLVAQKHEFIVVSGLAYGIDTEAHKASLQNNIKTVAVLAHGLDTIYPATHRKIAKDIIANGALVTEFLSKTKIDRNYFLQRNRIIAGLSDATIVIESAAKGGALVTADIANSYNRDVLTFPGRPSDTYSKGCNYLIKNNKAALIENAKDVELVLNWESDMNPQKPVQKKLFKELTQTEQAIVDILKENGEIPIDLISLKTKLPINQISVNLLELEFNGIVKTLPGKVYALR